jgi:undecaprenyl pyrophosphate phosphatase UppP
MPFIYLVLALITVGILGWLINARVPVAGRIRDIVNVVLALTAVGVVLGIINAYVPMAGSIKVILNIVVVVETCIGVLQALGLWKRTLRLFSNLTNHRIAH